MTDTPHQPLFSNYVLSSWKTGPERRLGAPTLNPTDGEGAGRCVEGRLFRLGLFARWAGGKILGREKDNSNGKSEGG